jgi:protein-tyrosine phosphatase
MICISNHQSYDHNEFIEKRSLYSPENKIKVSPFIVIDNPPTTSLEEDYDFHCPKVLHKLVDYIFARVIEGKNVAIDVKPESKCYSLIIAALGKKALSILSTEQAPFATEFVNLTDAHAKIIKDIDFQFAHRKWENAIEIPLGTSGKVFRGVMPRDVLFDGGAALQNWKNNGVDTVVCLNEKHEIEVGTSCNLIELYKENGFNVVHFPIRDYYIPEKHELREVIAHLSKLLSQGNNLLVHCWGGVGRTGLILSCLTKKVKEIDGKEAVQFIRNFVPKAVETEEQFKLVNTFDSETAL